MCGPCRHPKRNQQAVQVVVRVQSVYAHKLVYLDVCVRVIVVLDRHRLDYSAHVHSRGPGKLQHTNCRSVARLRTANEGLSRTALGCGQ
jgi:hypothetical protein